MKLEEALSSITAVKGVTSIIQGIMNKDYSVLPHDKGLHADLSEAANQIAIHKKQLDECKSDWAYWSILGDLEYWESVRDILEAASIVGHDNLPNVNKPDIQGCVVMDAIGRVREFGAEILRVAKQKQVKV